MNTWTDIPQFEGMYQITQGGEIRSIDRIIKHSLGGIKRKKGCLMKQKIDSKGYWAIKLCKDGKLHYLTVHRLLAITFIPNPENKPEVNHIDGVKTNCDLNNLEWATRLENQRHAFATKLIVIKKGAANHFSGRKGMLCHNSKKVQSTLTGEILNQGEAAIKLNISQAWLSLMLSGKQKNKTEYVRFLA